MGPKGYTSVTVKDEVDELIQAIADQCTKETGVNISKSQAIKICVEFYVKEHPGGENPG